MSPRGSEGGGLEENFALTTANQTTTTKGDNNKREEGGLENNQNISGLKVFAHSHRKIFKFNLSEFSPFPQNHVVARNQKLNW